MIPCHAQGTTEYSAEILALTLAWQGRGIGQRMTTFFILVSLRQVLLSCIYVLDCRPERLLVNKCRPLVVRGGSALTI